MHRDHTSGLYSNVEPRVAYNEYYDKFYALIVERHRQMYLLESNADVSSWTSYNLSDSGGSAGGLGRTFLPPNIVCEAHANRSYPGPRCYIYYSPYAQAAQYKSGRFRKCELTWQYSRWNLTNCADTTISGIEGVEVADYGDWAPQGYVQGPAWVFAYSRRNVEGPNTMLIFDNSPNFTSPYIDTANSGNPRACAYNHIVYGGTAIDYCEYCQRFVVVENEKCNSWY